MNIGRAKAWAPLPFGGMLLLNACAFDPGTTVDTSTASAAPVALKAAVQQSNIQLTDAQINARVKMDQALKAYQKKHRNSRVGEVLPAVNAWDFYGTYHSYKFPMSLPAISILGFGAGIEHEGGIKVFVNGQVVAPIVAPAAAAPEAVASNNFVSAIPEPVESEPLPPPAQKLASAKANIKRAIIKSSTHLASKMAVASVHVRRHLGGQPIAKPTVSPPNGDNAVVVSNDEVKLFQKQMTMASDTTWFPEELPSNPAKTKNNAEPASQISSSTPVFNANQLIAHNGKPGAHFDYVAHEKFFMVLAVLGVLATTAVNGAMGRKPRELLQPRKIFNQKTSFIPGSRIIGDFAAAGLGMTVRTATAFANKAWNNKSEIAVGMETSVFAKHAAKTGVKAIVANFHIAAVAATMPAWATVATTFAAAIALGAVAGGASGLVKATFFNHGKPREKYWALKAFGRGAAFGAIGGVVGETAIRVFGLDHALQHVGDTINKYVGGIMHGHAHALSHAQPALKTLAPFSENAAPVTQLPVHALPHAPQPTIVQHSVAPAVPKHVVVPPAAAPAIPAVHTVVAQPTVVHTVAPAPAPEVDLSQLDVTKLLTPAQMHSLPANLQTLALSKDPDDMVHFCKEASFFLNQHGEHAAASSLIQKGADFANAHNIDTLSSEQLNRDAGWVNLGHDGVQSSPSRALNFFEHARSLAKPYLAALKSAAPAPV